MATTEKQKNRIEQLETLGFSASSDKKTYVFGTMIISVNDLKAADDDKWGEIITELKSFPPEESQTNTPQQPSVEGEHLTQEETPKDIVVMGGPRSADQDIATLDINEKIIIEWREKYTGITISSLDDKENILKLQEAKKFIRGRRTSLEAKRKQLKAYYIEEGNKIDAVAKKYTNLIVEIENPLDVELEKFDGWKTADDERKQKEAETETNRRVVAIKEAGMAFNGSYYVLGENMSMDLITIKSFTLADFDFFVEKVKIEKKRLDAVAEERRLEHEAAERKLRAQRLELRGQMAITVGMTFSPTADNGAPGYIFKNEAVEVVLGQSIIESAEDSLFMQSLQACSRNISEAKQKVVDDANKKQQEQIDNMRRQRIQLRETMAKTIGLKFYARLNDSDAPGYVFSNEFGQVILDQEFIQTSEDAEFTAKITEYTSLIADLKTKEEEKKNEERRLQMQFENRASHLSLSMGMTKSDNNYSFKCTNVANKVAIIYFDDIRNLPDNKWQEKLEGLNKLIAEIQDDQEGYEKREKQKVVELQERQHDLINLGMMSIGGEYIRRNEFGDKASISVEQVAAIDHDNWSSCLTALSADVDKVNALTEQKRQQIKDKEEARKPEIQRVREYAENIGSMIAPDVKDEKVLGIMVAFNSNIASAINKCNNLLLAIENDH